MAKRKAPQGVTAGGPPNETVKKPVGKRARFEGPPPKISPASTNEVERPAKGKKVIKQPKVAPTPAAPTTVIVSAGSYERLLYGLTCTFDSEPSTSTGLPYSLNITPYFAFPAHLSSLKAVAASQNPSPATGTERKVGGKYLVSGGTDEVVKVWDLRRRREVGVLEGQQTGSITCLRFVAARNMLISASTDSSITLYRVRDWVLLRSLKGHKGRVNSVDAHPDGRVALSVGQDKMLRMWDLVAGKSVATLKLGGEGELVRWNTNGNKFVVITGNNLTVYGIDMTILHALSAPSRFHDAHFCYFPLDAQDPTQCEYMFVACEDGKTRIFDVSEPTVPSAAEDEEIDPSTLPNFEPVAQLVGHANRVKMMDLLEVALPTSTNDTPASTVLVSTASSDGLINIYDLALLGAAKKVAENNGGVLEIEPSATHDTDGTRLTCVCAIGMAERKGDGTKATLALGGEGAGDGDSESEEDEEEGEEDGLESAESDDEEEAEFAGIESELEDDEEEEGEGESEEEGEEE